MKNRSVEKFEKETKDVVDPMANWSRVVVETDEKNPKILAVITNTDCESAENLRVRFKPTSD